jgi:hypothetical protein
MVYLGAEFNNNVRLEDQEWGTEHAPNFDVNAAGKSQSLKALRTTVW